MKPIRGDNMTEQDLRNYTSLKKELEQINERIQELEHAKYSISSPTWSDMPTGGHGDHDKIGAMLTRIEEQTEMYWDKYKELLEIQSDIEEKIEKLEPIERTVMRYKYFEGKTFENIADIINYSFMTVRRIHKKSIKKLQKMQHEQY